MNPLDH